MAKPSLKELQFRQKLTGSTSDLLKKLKDLQAELKDLEQETVDTKSFSSVTKQLIDPSIVNHKDKGVRIYAACCIADMLRLYAPDAPYNNTQLKVIFGLFVSELRHIADTSSAYANMYYYLLESLSVVKSIVLITDLKNAEELMTTLFKNVFDDIRPQQAKNVQICMSELLQHIIDESAQLPQEIVDIILAQFLHKHKFDNPAAYRLACDLGNNCAERLQRYVFQYFSDIISTAGNGELSHKELEDFKTVHKLVIELNKSTPALLLNVIPQLEEELKLSDVTIRTLATRSLGEMFSEKTSQLATQYESTWKAWLQRRNDKIPQVRIAWIESLVDLIKNHASLSKELSDCLSEKLVDPDEKVRAVACKIIGEFDYETSLHHIQKSTLIQVGHRCRDKKKSVSKEAITTLAVLYNQAYPEIENGTKAGISHFGWMASAILHAVYVNDNEIFSFVDHAIYTTVFPPHGSAASRTQRIVTTFSALDDKGRTGFLSVLRRSVDARSHMTALLKLLETREKSKENGGGEDFEKKLGSIIKVISDRLPDPVKSSLLLYKYASVHDSTFLQLISDCMDSRQSLKEIRKAAKDTIARIENVSPPILEIFTILIQRISVTLINSEVISELIQNIAGSDENRQISGELLRSISPIFPAIFIDHLAEITALLRNSTFVGASDALQTLAEFAKQFPKSVPADAMAKETLRQFLTSGTIAQATDATIVLASIADNDAMCRDIVEDISEDLDSSPNLLKNLAILSQITLYSPQVFERVSGAVVAFIMKKLLLTNTKDQETQYDATEDWVEKSELDQYSLSKLMGLKVLVNRAIVLLESDPEAAHSAVRPVFQLLWALINQEGELVAEKNTNAVMKSHLRLNAARFVIKLTRGRPAYEKMVAVSDYSRLALVIQDPVYRVRHGFATRIMKYLRAKELHIRYLAVLILVAHEPEVDWKSQVQKFLIIQSKSQAIDSNLMLNELTLARSLHLLSNHPDFVIKVADDGENDVFGGALPTHSVQDMNLAAKYIEFYLDTMANSENISLIFYVASLMKTVRFANPNDNTHNLYILSDLAQYLIQERSRSHGWTLTSYPGQVKLPRELFTPLAQNDVSVEISTKNYLPTAWVQAREHKTERKPKTPIERKMGQATKRRSRSPSPHSAEDMEDVVGERGVSSPSRAKRPKKAKAAERVAEEPTRKMASRAAKAKATVYKDAESSDEEAEEMESDLESS
ncbi:hypothetical protein EC957_006500 [Mortierella hygrophila]|uniref:Sister chromatid cohesion protein PDS5 n=1 Tax=Mortierella hygrophila TaxID=979708 RepID=A0A9P6FHS0_9FUNG|nr:hypothetical protein EC957_006500 [Mortierella hygrophila]